MRLNFKNRLVLLIFSAFSLSGLAAHAQQTCQSYIDSDVPNERFIINDNATVVDKLTKLMWARCTVGRSKLDCSEGEDLKMNWQDALSSAENSDHAGFTDWRLPNIDEYRSLADYRCARPAVNLSVFPNISNRDTFYWTGMIPVRRKQFDFKDDEVVVFNFKEGSDNLLKRNMVFARVLLVRDHSLQKIEK